MRLNTHLKLISLVSFLLFGVATRKFKLTCGSHGASSVISVSASLGDGWSQCGSNSGERRPRGSAAGGLEVCRNLNSGSVFACFCIRS